MKLKTLIPNWHRRSKATAFASAAFFAVAIACGSTQLHAQITFNGTAGDGNWFTGGNWVGGVAPNGAATDAAIGAFSVDVDGNVNLNSLNVGTGGVLNILNNQNFDFGGSASTTINNAGSINAGNNTDLQLGGTVNNSGTITANFTGGSVFTDLEVRSSGATLQGSGTVTLNGANARIVGLTGATLNIADQTINGGGRLGDNTLGIINGVSGLIDATDATQQLTIDSSGAGVVNNGLIRASGGATLGIAGSNVTNNGTIEATATSTVRLQNNARITGGLITGDGTIDIDPNVNVGFTNLEHTGTTNVGNNSDLELTGSINNSGNISVNFTGGSVFTDVEVQSTGATLEGGGTVTLDGANARVVGLTGATLNIADQTINGGGQLGANTLGIINGDDGIIDATDTGQQLTIDSSGAGVVNNGLIRASGGATLGIAGSNVTNTDGTIEATSGSTIRLQSEARITGGSISGAIDVDANSNVGFINLDHNGTTNVGNNSDLEVTGTINNTGNISVNFTGGSVFTDLEVQSSGATLEGGGSVTLSGNNARIQGGAATLFTNVDNVIEGFGRIGDNSLTIDNQATIDANLGGQTLTVDSGAGGLTNTGQIQASDGGILRINGTELTNTGGNITSNAGSRVELGSNASITGGTIGGPGEIEVLDNTNVFLRDLSIEGDISTGNNIDLGITGAIDNSADIQVNFTGGSVFSDLEVQSSGATLTGGGSVTLNGANARIQGAAATSFTNVDNVIQGDGRIGDNSLTIDNQATIDANESGLTLTIDSGAGGLTNTGQIQASGGGILRINGTELTNTGGNITSNAVSRVELGNNASITGGTIGGPGEIEVLANTNVFLEDLSIGGDITTGNNIDLGVTGTIDNSADIQVNFTGGSVFSDLEVQSSGATLTGDGTVTLNGTNARIVGVSGSTLVNDSNTIRGFGRVGDNTVDIQNLVQGTIDANVAGQTLTLDPVGSNTTTTFVNEGTLRASNGGNLDVLHAVVNEGTVNTGAGSTFEARSLSNSLGSLLSGDGTVDVEFGSILVAGDVAPGNGTTGTLTLLDDAVFANTAVLQTELASDSLFDRLEVDGDLTLDGLLEISLLSSFNPLRSDVFSIASVTAFGAEILGEFANASDGSRLLTTDGTGSFVVNYSGSEVTLSNFTAVPEPSAAICLVGLAMGLLARRKRTA